MSSGNSSLESTNTEPLTRSYSERNSDRNRDYDGLKQQCDKAIHELQILRRQNNETNRRCEQTLKEKEYYRSQHHAAMSQLEVAAEESSTLRSKYSELVTDKVRLDREISELRSGCCNQSDVTSPEGNSNDGFNNRYVVSVNKYEALKDDYEKLRQRYDDLLGSRNNAIEFKQEEINRLKERMEEMIVEHNNVVIERNDLKQQCTQAVRKWNITFREREKLEADLKKIQQQYEDSLKDAMNLRISMKHLTDARNDTLQEYNLVMSERDSVHKEMEKLSEDLSQAYKKIKILENEIKEHIEQRKTLSYLIETLKREIASALHDRDKALKECNDFREKFGELTAKEKSQREAFKSRFDYSYIRERDLSHKDSCEMQATSMNLFSKCQKETMDNLDQANQEIEKLRKYIDKQQTELQEALQEAEVSKRRRDWAFEERDKIVMERESIRTLCDRLRKERDRAVSDLAEALRDSDDIKRQRNETSKELKDLKEKMEAQMEKENRMLQLNTAGHNYSHDSAIDTDLQEWDTEMLSIDLNALATVDDLGVDLVGGRDDPYYPNDSGIYVASVNKGSIVDGKLRVNDCILRVNNLDCSNVSKRMILETVRSCGGNCNILVKRRCIGARSLFTTQLNNYDHGLLLETGMYICKIAPGSLAAKEGNLAVGDRVLSINNKPMDGLKTAQEAMAILNQPADVLIITTLKSTHCSNNCSGGSNKDVYRKYTNSSTQTEARLNFRYDNHQPSTVPPKPQVEKSTSNMGKWDTVTRTKEFVRGRRILKPEKKPNRNSSPVTFDQERDDAIAELDSVIESYHAKHASRQQQQQQQQQQQVQRIPQKNKELEKNGGTWPKARIGTIIEHSTGTIMHPRKKERSPLSLLLTHPSNYNVPQSCCSNTCPEETRSSGQKDSSIDYSVQSGNIGKDVLEYYAKKKVSKYAVNDVVDSSSEPPHSRTNSQLYTSPYSLTPFIPMPHHAQLLDSRYPSSNIPSSQSGESISLTETRPYCFEPSYNTMAQFHHKHSPSADSSYHKLKALISPNAHSHGGMIFRSSEIPESYHRFEGGTFPRKKENQRFRIPSNPSAASKNNGKLSTGSIEKSSERGSPVPTFQVKLLNQRQNKRNSLPNYCWSHKPAPGDERIVKIEKSVDPLGISIQCLENGAVFVSNVKENSLAYQVGLQVGDQLLEVCGINMRNAPHEWAERVLGNCGDSITMHVQYNPHKYNAVSGSDSSATSGEDESRSDTHSGSPTPCNSPQMNRKSTPSSTLSHSPYMHTVTTLTRPKLSEKPIDQKSPAYEPRYLILETHKCSNLGISLVGGNAVGIYVHSVTSNSLAYNAGLRTGDHILEYNGTDLRHATAEEAAFELAKPADNVKVLVQNELDRYNQIKDKPGDSFYIRALFDRTGDLGDNLQLQFRKDDILFVDNTMLNGVPGNWRAWLINQDGYHQQCGIIPSKYKVEEELLKRSLGDLEGDARRGTRRSFFRRKKQRCDSKELASFSNINLDWFGDSGSLNEETTLASYQKVTRLNSEPMLRPVLIVGPLADCVIDKLLTDFPGQFNRCVPEVQYNSQAFMEKCLSDNIFIDYRKKGNTFECITIAALKEAFNKHCHCILDINLASVKRLHSNHVYPIVLLIKFKSTKQIKEVKDTRYLSDKTSAKAAKEMYEHALKLESEYRHYISAVIPAGANVTYLCTQIKAAVDSEQNKTIWVPSSTS